MINYEEIIDAITGVNLWGKDQETGIERGIYLERIEGFSKAKEDVIAIIGVRRAGKTYLAKQFLKAMASKTKKEQTLYVNFEEPRLDPHLSLRLLDEIYNAYRAHINRDDFAYMVLDEIQNIEKWEKWVRMMQERKENVKIIVTGSSSKLLCSEFATVLTGRNLNVNVFPPSFAEFLSFGDIRLENDYDILTKREQIRRLLVDYIGYGGFPKIVLEENKVLKREYLIEIFEGVIYRDVVSRHNIKNSHMVRIVAEIAINNFSSLMSANKLRNTIINIVKRKVSPNLILDILNYLEDAYLLFYVPIFSYKIREGMIYPRKVYCIDTGLINAVSFKPSENAGRLMENVVAIELKRRGETIYYWKDKYGKEVDFVITECSKPIQLVQVCYNAEDPKTKKREISALAKAMDEFEISEGQIITENYEGEEKTLLRNGKQGRIKYIPLWKWLLT